MKPHQLDDQLRSLKLFGMQETLDARLAQAAAGELGHLELLADLAGGHADRTFAARLRHWARPALLIVDDFAMRDFTLAQADDLYELVTERMGRPAIFTANRAVTDWYSLFPNPVVAESILDRVVNAAHHVHMDGKSYRPLTRPGRRPPP